MGDLVLFAKDGYAFKDGVTGALVDESKGYLGTHGYSNSDPELDGVFFASGYGIRPGIKLDRIRNLDVAPTIAELLGVPLPDVDGREQAGAGARGGAVCLGGLSGCQPVQQGGPAGIAVPDGRLAVGGLIQAVSL